MGDLSAETSRFGFFGFDFVRDLAWIKPLLREEHGGDDADFANEHHGDEKDVVAKKLEHTALPGAEFGRVIEEEDNREDIKEHKPND